MPATGTWEVRTGAPVTTGNANTFGLVLLSYGSITATRTWTIPAVLFLYLDGSVTPINVGSLPLGWTPNQNCLCSNISGDGVVGGTTDCPACSAVFDVDFLTITQTVTGLSVPPTFDGVLDGVDSGNVLAGILTAGNSIITLVGVAVLVDHGTGNYGVNPAVAAPTGALSITGTYFTWLYDWTITTPGGSPVRVGDRIVITANLHGGSSGYHDFTDLTHIKLSYPAGGGITREITIWRNSASYGAYFGEGTVDLGGYPISYANDPAGTTVDLPEFTNDYGPSVIEWGTISIEIVIPFGFGDYSGPVTIAGGVNEPTDDPDNPDPFTGSVPLSPVTILYADTSGIYNITPNKRTDTLYNGARDGSSDEVAIPKPFIKTGFIGG